MSVAYHTVVQAMEGQAGCDPVRRFALAVTHALDGHAAYSRYYLAGEKRQRSGSGTAWMERTLRDWMATDVNPIENTCRVVRTEGQIVRASNTYNQRVNLGVKTLLGDFSGPLSLAQRRSATPTFPRDLAICRDMTLMKMELLCAEVRGRTRVEAGFQVLTLRNVLRYLGLEASPYGQILAVIEERPLAQAAEIARCLGVRQRTLERRAREGGLTVDAIRQAARLVRATQRLNEATPLTRIAAEEGYADLAHMTREFRRACGVPPSLIRKVVFL